MTDKEKLEKLVAEIERLYHQSLVDENRQAELGLSSAACTSYGKSKVCKELLSFTDSMQKEPKECMYTRNDYTDEDRKVLCDGCEEDCRFDKKEESVNNGIDLGCGVIWKDEEPVCEDLEKAASRYAKEEYSRKNPATLPDRCIGCYAPIMYAFRNGAIWKEQRLMANAVDIEVKVDAGGYPYIPQMELYDYENDIPLAKEGDKYKVILIKEG